MRKPTTSNWLRNIYLHGDTLSEPPQLNVVDAANGTNSGYEARTRIARSILSNWAGLGANLLVGLLLAPFIVHRLGNTAYGIWALVLQLTGYMGVVDVGLRSALVRFVARFHAEQNQSAMNRLLTVTRVLYGALAVVCLIVGALLAGFVLPHMHIPATMLRESQVVLVLAAGTMAAGFTLGRFQPVLAGLSRWDLINAVNIGTLLFRTALIVLFLMKGYGLVTVGIIHFLTSVTAYWLCAFLARRLLPWLDYSWRLSGLDDIWPILRHSLYSFLISAGNRIIHQVDTIVIAVFLPVENVAFYVIGLKLAEYLGDLVNASAQIVSPLASGLEAEGRAGELGSLLVRGTKYSLLVIYLLNVSFLLLGRDFIRLWMGQQYAEPSGGVLMILSLGLFFSATQNMGSHMLYGLSKHGVNVWCTSVEAVLNLGLSLVLVRRFGILGVAAGTAVAAAVVRGWLFPRAFLRILNVSPRTYVRLAILPVLLPTLCFTVGISTFRAFLDTGHIGALVLAGAAGLVLHVPCVWFFSLDEAERGRVRQFRPCAKWKTAVAG